MSKTWLKYAGIRAIKTFAQAFASGITVGLAFYEINWGYLASCAAVAAVYSLLTSLAGIPEVDNKPQKEPVADATPINIADTAPVLDAETGEEKTYAEIKAEEIE